MIGLLPGMTIRPLESDGRSKVAALIREPHLILFANQSLDKLVVIPVAPRQSNDRRYFVGYRTLSFQEVQEQCKLEEPILTVQPYMARPATTWSDEDLNKKFTRKGMAESIPLTNLRAKWALIQPLVTNSDKELLFYPEHLHLLVRARAGETACDSEYKRIFGSTNRFKKEEKRSGHRESLQKRIARLEKEIQRSLNQYWAGGSVRGALIGFSDLNGGRGKAKRAGEKKRGARSKATKADQLVSDGMNVEEGSQHAKIIKYCYDHYVIRGTTEAAACRRMYTEFYSQDVQRPDGTIGREWLPEEQRPTRSHFRYWGTKESASLTAWRKHLPPAAFEKSFRALMGSASDDVYAIGQRGGIDSSPPDIQFVRACDRIARVGGGRL